MTKITWEDFRNTGALWFINSVLHVFGLAIVLEANDSGEVEAYPARTPYRGFPAERNNNGYLQIQTYLKENIEQILKETKE